VNKLKKGDLMFVIRDSQKILPLREVDQVEVISLQDNIVELLTTVDREEVQTVLQWVESEEGEGLPLPLAEHGLAMLIRTRVGQETHTVLFDAGLTEEGTLINAEIMKLDLSPIEAIVVSHGHFDHSGGLLKVLVKLDRKGLPILVHEDMFKPRGTEKDGKLSRLPSFPSEEQLESRGAKLIKTKEPYLLAGDTVLVMGEVPRVTEFEQGFLPGRILVDGEWQPDPWMWDDRGAVIQVRGKGLVVISGCAHSGIVNNVRYAQELTGGEEPIYAVLGGFHLVGEEFEPIIESTVAAIKEMNPAMVVPSHCTGWKGIHAFAQAMPKAFVHPGVGNLYRFQAS
jgi:7,8-dihydropterin-6-yl-methyl-4-(beta-D-ribofuranosyl)aminobenzene 5'-phosphate synthase